MNSVTQYDTLNAKVLEAIPETARHVLDVGCGTGRLGQALKMRQACHVTGITHSRDEACQAREWMDEVLEIDLEHFVPTRCPRFDAVVLSHVLEHIRDPRALLERVLAEVLPGATVVVALPNVLWWRQRLEFLRGRYRYEDSGLMDRTHVHFFDWASAHQMLREAGLVVSRSGASGGWPGSRFLGPAKSLMDRAAVSLSPGLFGGEFLFVCQRPPSAGVRV